MEPRPRGSNNIPGYRSPDKILCQSGGSGDRIRAALENPGRTGSSRATPLSGSKDTIVEILDGLVRARDFVEFLAFPAYEVLE